MIEARDLVPDTLKALALSFYTVSVGFKPQRAKGAKITKYFKNSQTEAFLRGSRPDQIRTSDLLHVKELPGILGDYISIFCSHLFEDFF
jgi:hypothetical protein